ncbi:hypothetical protein L202_08064 [Cryptococcus amylolentus CBS 6039]|uniref:Uncharacterized protein n=1 Tax=Cryptococcus amylolentus CBS 6039 TaxID=1295533 RepID=A0A1E3HB71_9TREE|nr:hypothetical protein L202_08064 [Cryptococcus amylolentus CBS 6039]ODN73564.1 hypothetical protein L202_08064 [Cryptococcus amylolentus CBS 6039]
MRDFYCLPCTQFLLGSLSLHFGDEDSARSGCAHVSRVDVTQCVETPILPWLPTCRVPLLFYFPLRAIWALIPSPIVYSIAHGIDNTTPRSQTLHLLPTIPMLSHQYALQLALGRVETIDDSALVGIQDAPEGSKKEIFDEASKGILARVIVVLDALELRWAGRWEGEVCETTRMDLERLL